MTGDEFRAILARSGGLIGTEVIDKATDEEIAGVKTGEKIPPTSVRLRYTTPNGEITAREHDDGSFEILDDPKGLVKGAAAAADKPAPAPTVRNLPDGSQEEWDPATKKWVQHAPAAKKPKTAPELDLGQSRPGQKTDLRTVKMQFDLFAQQLAADPNVTPDQYNQRIQAYIATNVTPAIQRATDEVNAYNAQQEQIRTDAATRAAARETRLDTTADRSEARSFAEFQQRAGQDTVSNALKLLEYQHNPLFLEQLSTGLNTLSRGGGPVTFTPEAFRIPLPDTNALAEQGAQRAAALYASAGGVPFTPRPMAGAVGQPTPLGGPPGPLPTSSAGGTMLAGVPLAPPPPRPWDPASAGGPGSSPIY